MADVVVDEFQRIYARAGARIAFLSAARNIYLDAPFGRGGFYPRLAELEPPALFVWGSHDALIPAAFERHVAELAALAPSRSCSTAAATCRRSSAPSRPAACCSASSRGSTRWVAACARAPPAAAAVDSRTMSEAAHRPPPARRRNGHRADAAAVARLRRAAPPPRTAGRRRPADRGRRGLVARDRAAAAQVTRRIPTADLDERDPDYIRENLPGLWLLASLWFRGEVRGLGNIPEDGPVLLVGNHSGGNLTPDTASSRWPSARTSASSGASTSSPTTSCCRCPASASCASTAPSPPRPRTPSRRCEAGAALLVYPGGDDEVHRPSWERHKVDFAGRKGFVRLALEHDVPIVPVVAIGGQETALFLAAARGSRARSCSTGSSA